MASDQTPKKAKKATTQLGRMRGKGPRKREFSSPKSSRSEVTERKRPGCGKQNGRSGDKKTEKRTLFGWRRLGSKKQKGKNREEKKIGTNQVKERRILSVKRKQRKTEKHEGKRSTKASEDKENGRKFGKKRKTLVREQRNLRGKKRSTGKCVV